MAVFSVFLPLWGVDLVRLRRRLRDGAPILLKTVDRQREIVAGRCERCARAGVEPGMTIAHARALLPGVDAHVSAHDACADARALRRLAMRATRFAPIVGVDRADGLLIDAGGCERLYGGLAPMAGRILRDFSRLGLTARLAGAPTFGAAWALARWGARDCALYSESDVESALAALPVEGLRLDGATAGRLKEVGVERIGQLAALPRAAVATRYGSAPLLRLDQAMGRAFETIEPVRAAAPVAVEVLFDGPTKRAEDVALCARQLVGAIAARLGAMESGCRKLRATLIRSDLGPVSITLRVSRPTRDAGHLWSLLRPRLEGAHLGFGVEGVRLLAGGIARIAHAQLGTGPEAGAGQERAEVARLVDTLASSFGDARVLRLRATPSHRPERAYTATAAISIDRRVGGAEAPEIADADRPSLLRARPLSIEAVAFLPEGPVAALKNGGSSLAVVRCVGPERIEPEWWRADRCAPRDYYKVLVETGRWLWIYREIGPDSRGRWFLHGVWA